jgi:acetyl-CoA C-acetyltransferase
VTVSRSGVFIEGVGLEITWQDRTRNLSELIFTTVRKAIDDAGRGMEGIDSVVLGAHDLVDGRSLSSMVTAPAAGAYLRDEIRYSDDGAAAFAAAVTRIESGESKRTIVAAWARASEHDVDAVSRVLFDPFFGRPLGLEELDVSGMRAQAWIREGGDRSTHPQAVQKRKAAMNANPRSLKSGGRRSSPRYPLAADDLPVWADVVAAVIISADPSRVRLAGLGQSSEPYWIGDRRLAEMSALRTAASRALDEAQLIPSQLDLLEVDGLSLFDEALGMEAIGVAPKGGGLTALARDPRCNPSGGGSGGYCAPAMGLARIVEASLQLQSRAGPIQLTNVRRAMATGSSVVAGQTQTAVILEAA